MTEQSDSNKIRDEIVEGEIIAEFGDDTLMNLPALEKDRHESIGTARIEDVPKDSGRRQILVRLMMGGAAALALGGSAALLLNRREEPSVIILPNGAAITNQGSVDVAKLVQQISDLQDTLKQATTERDQLKAQLAKLTVDYQQIKPILDKAQALNALWKSMDEIGIDDLLRAALAVLEGSLMGVMLVVVALQTGVKDGQAALDYITNNLPKPQLGMKWLSTQMTSLSKSLDDIALHVQQAIDPVQPYAQLISNFVVWVLNQLPFNIGAKARAGLEGMQSVIAGLPDLVNGVTQDVLDPLAVWFGGDPLRNLSGILLTPLSDRVVKPATNLVTRMDSFNNSFKDLLADPMSDALSRRSEIRAQIQKLENTTSG